MRTGELELPKELLIGAQAGEGASYFARARTEVFRFLPVWMYFFYGCLLLNAGLTNFTPSRTDTAWTVFFPYAVFVGFYVARVFRSPTVQSRALMLCATVVPAAVWPVVNLAFHRPSPVQGEALLKAFELSNFVFAALMIFHALKHRKGHVALFFGAGLIYGALLENGGIVLGFFHETNLTMTLVPPLVAPVATMIGWCIMLYLATFTVWYLRSWFPVLRESSAFSGVLVGVIATMLDLQIDPLATAAGCWVWDSSLPPFFLGVPLVNFVAWVCAIAPFAYLMFRYQKTAGIRDRGEWSGRDVMAMAARGPYALVLAFLSWFGVMGLLEGANGPTWGLVYRFCDHWLARLVG